ncbi:MAG TPA: Crp/Fnr family transcriptional regulator [Chitinophagales bacterium]|nr:Crp/Fnr family transcriptional regulator [Chitinophagales bacterium]HQV77079.1 Crp/Fnr family transcriptional regulator [Chitinophagales bacterium]HQW77854.1 Crp/Fnr family transcriptional regulator [Chitinophagales bacterium]HRB68060.1 Crp/Fnr family transcriptional regulator [Chitinophagales bacterium]
MNNLKAVSFLNFLRQFGELPDELARAIQEKSTYLELPKKHILFRQGKVCNQLYFIEKGLARNYYEVDGKEQTTDISLNDELLVSFSSFISRKPSLENIELLEDCTLYALEYEDLQDLYANFKEMERLGRLMAEHYFISLAAKNYSLKFQNTTERYENLFRMKIEIIKRVPIGVIASYLGMSIETLSRIRSKQD